MLKKMQAMQRMPAFFITSGCVIRQHGSMLRLAKLLNKVFVTRQAAAGACICSSHMHQKVLLKQLST